MSNNVPMEMELEAGTYYWCACGRTGKEPFCDGSHCAARFKDGDPSLSD